MARPRRTRAQFRPNFTLVLLYLAAGTLAFGILLSLPALLDGVQALGPGPEVITDEELARGREITRNAIEGKLWIAVVLSTVVVAAGTWWRKLPGLRR